jgi:hypothetical protein
MATPAERTAVIRQFYSGESGMLTLRHRDHRFTAHKQPMGEVDASDSNESDEDNLEDVRMQGHMMEGNAQFTTVFAAVFLAIIIESVISVCLIVGVKTERRWFMIPHIITSLFSIISTSFRLFSVVSVGSNDRLISAFLTIAIEIVVFWVPYRCFIYLREKERVMSLDARLQGMPFDGAMIIRANPNDANMLAHVMAPPPSYTAAYVEPPAYKQSDEAPPAYQQPEQQGELPAVEGQTVEDTTNTNNK